MMHAEVLPPEQQACLRQLGPAATALGFHLIGGTAVAIHFGHRQSVDFDWCTQQFPVEPVNLTAALAGLADLSAMELLAVSQRGTKKDFVDVHVLVGVMPLKAMIDAYCCRFGVSDPGRVPASLCYFDDAEAEPMPRMLVPSDWDAIKEDIRRQVRAIA